MTSFRIASGRVAQGLVVVSLVLAAACASHRRYQNPNGGNGRYTPPTTSTDSRGDVQNERRDDAGRYAHKAPPANPVESPGAQPGSQYVWVPGHYSWDGNDFQWQGGQWTIPPTGFHNWLPGHWDQVGSNNWSYSEGQWQ